MLLILDNAEHLLLEVALLCERLLRELPGLSILVTSRELLRTAGETVYRLRPLETPAEDDRCTAAEIMAFPAVRLFLERAESVGAVVALSDADAAIVAGICRKLDGIALAIELAAGRADAFSLEELASLLDSQIALRWHGRRTAPSRQRTMNATLDWSYRLLIEDEQTVLRRLSIFVGGFTLEHVQAVVSGSGLDEAAALEAFGGLVAKSLVSRDAGGSGIPRYKLLETTRAYSAQKLVEAGEHDALRRRHAEYFRDRLQQLESELDSLKDKRDSRAAELDNIRSALRWAFGPEGDAVLGVDLAAYASLVLLENALFAECIDWMIRARDVLSRLEIKASKQELLIETSLGNSEIFELGYSDQRKADWPRVLELATKLGDTPRQVNTYLALWSFEQRAPNYERGFKQALECAEAVKDIEDPNPTAIAEWMLGITKLRLGRLADAQIHLQRLVESDTETARMVQLRGTGYDHRVSAMAGMANLLWLRGLPDKSREWGSRAVDEARRLGRPAPIFAALMWTGLNKYFFETDIELLEQDLVELLERARARSAEGYEGAALCILGLCQNRRGDYEAAKPLVSKGLQLLAKTRFGPLNMIVRTHMCEAVVQAGELEIARELMNGIQEDDRNPEHWCKSELLRVEAVLKSAGREREAAEKLLAEICQPGATARRAELGVEELPRFGEAICIRWTQDGCGRCSYACLREVQRRL